MINAYKVIRTYIPINVTPPKKWPMSESQIIEISPPLSQIIDYLRDSDPVGKIGNYGGVYEIGLGLEGYVPLKFSHPTLGNKNTSEETPSISFSTYAANTVKKEVISNFVEGLASLHPWEHPVIEIVSIQLWMPNK